MKLTPQTTLDDFHKSYWYLRDLVAFCRAYGLDSSGRKQQLEERVEAFLKHGQRVSAKPKKRPQPPPSGPLTPATEVTQHFSCDAATRAFFQSLIGDHFHFTAHLQKFRREHKAPLTYGDLAREWTAEYERRKDKNYKSKIDPTWQYNQFLRDFMADKPRNKGKTIGDAAKAWTRVRQHSGPHNYAEYLRIS